MAKKKSKARVSDEENIGSEEETENQSQNPSSSAGKSLYEVSLIDNWLYMINMVVSGPYSQRSMRVGLCVCLNVCISLLVIVLGL